MASVSKHTQIFFLGNTKNVRIIVMKNLLPSGLEMHHKFDLKGSTYKRKASRKERNKSHPTFKDLDFMDIYPDGILLQPELYNSLFDTKRLSHFIIRYLFHKNWEISHGGF